MAASTLTAAPQLPKRGPQLGNGGGPQLGNGGGPQQTNCDGRGIMSCQIGTCYTGLDGFIGCCSTTKCAARTTCFGYAPSAHTTCNPDYDGCLTCSNSALPHCNTLTNPLARQYILWCDSTSVSVQTTYANLVTTGSVAAQANRVASSSATAAPSTVTLIPTNAQTMPVSTSSADIALTIVPSPPGSTLSPGGIAGVVVGAILGGAVLVGLGLLLLWRCGPKKANNKDAKVEPVPMYSCRDEKMAADERQVHRDDEGRQVYQPPPSEMEGSPASANPAGFASPALSPAQTYEPYRPRSGVDARGQVSKAGQQRRVNSSASWATAEGGYLSPEQAMAEGFHH